jgi:hypothetical protein
MDLHTVSTLFSYEPVATGFLLFLVTITALAFVVGACIGGYGVWDRMKKKRQVHTRSAAAA